MITQAIPLGSLVYIRYKDHVLFRDEVIIPDGAAECETVGWLTKEDSECMCIINDRVFKSHNYTRNKKSGFVLVKCCVLEIRALPLQGVPRGSLSCPEDKATTAEYALQTAKRKTQPK